MSAVAVLVGGPVDGARLLVDTDAVIGSPPERLWLDDGVYSCGRAHELIVVDGLPCPAYDYRWHHVPREAPP